MSFRAIQFGATSVDTSKITLGKLADTLASSSAKLLATRAVFVAALKAKKWNSYLEKVGKKWERERQEYNQLARAFKLGIKKKYGKDIKVLIVQSKDKSSTTSVEGFGEFGAIWLVAIAALVPIAVAAAGAWAATTAVKAYLQHKRISNLDEEIREAAAKLPPDQQVKYLSLMSKGKEAALAPSADYEDGEGVVDRIKRFWSETTGGTKTALTVAGAGLLLYVGYNVYRGRKISLSGADHSCLQRWTHTLNNLAREGMLDRPQYRRETARLLMKECSIPYDEAHRIVLRISRGR